MVLSDANILTHLYHTKNIVIDPFNKENLSPTSYDVSLGEWYFEEEGHYGCRTYNPWSEKDIRSAWGEPKRAKPLEKEKPLSYNYKTMEGMSPDDQVIFIRPGATILGHTIEFIGGRHSISTEIQPRVSWGRNFIEVRRYSGCVGFINRWTMEITNNSLYHTIPLVVGRRIAQIVFLEVGNVIGSYPEFGKYQTSNDLVELKERWSPGMMLPKLYLDREVTRKKV